MTADPVLEADVRKAIVDAVRARVGSSAEVGIDDLQFSAAPRTAERLIATPDPGARLARPARFALACLPDRPGAVPVRVGHAVARVSVSVEHVRAARPLAPGQTLGPGDLVGTRGDVGAVPLRRLPTLDEVAGSRTLRSVEAGLVLSASSVALRRLVQSGDVVVVRVVADGLVVEGSAVATQHGSAGDTIRVVNPDTRRAMKARVTGRGEVEVIQ